MMAFTPTHFRLAQIHLRRPESLQVTNRRGEGLRIREEI